MSHVEGSNHALNAHRSVHEPIGVIMRLVSDDETHYYIRGWVDEAAFAQACQQQEEAPLLVTEVRHVFAGWRWITDHSFWGGKQLVLYTFEGSGRGLFKITYARIADNVLNERRTALSAGVPTHAVA
ncbi:hypothetical protein KDW82_08470 [Burkholderia vietnamiensis]|uniref:hypothetical protein n=1 Tax=Burkholderia vietnamiensis TaxID=60552 RepID=UPI001B944A55|nr:hypothetical protein [Burkholderia vietnamiensis]MBR8189092.1 hypothetical protein [Burkholderia vietnamiensis]HDR9174313.1 hypothetical protein [Burkholderia vietnamiensis]